LFVQQKMRRGGKRRQENNCADSERCVISHLGKPSRFAFGCSTLTAVSSIQPDGVVHEAKLGRRISGSGPSSPKSDSTPCAQLTKDG
jgi:hypothetical protein